MSKDDDGDYDDGRFANLIASEEWGVEKGTPSYRASNAWDHVTKNLVPRMWALRHEIYKRGEIK